MILVINLVVGSIVMVILIMSIISCVVTRKKYNNMINTMGSLEHDKNLLLIEKEYRRSNLKNRLEHIRIFVDKEFYQIKIAKLPLYIIEDFSIYGIYFSILLGITFTFINLAITTNVYAYDMFEIFLLSIISFVSCMIIMLVRTLSGVFNLRDIFKIQLCSYLEYELELFDEASINEECEEESQKNSKVVNGNENHEKGGIDVGQFGHDFIYSISNGGKIHGEELEDYNEPDFINVLDEIFG